MNKKCNTVSLCKEEKIIFLKKGEYKIMECKTCGHRFTEVHDIENHVNEVYSDDYFFAGKQGYPNYLDEKDILFNYGINYSKLVSKYTKAGRVLDVGCAAGFILKGFQQSGWNCHGLEPNDRMAEYGRNKLNLNISTGNLETFQTTQEFDLVNLVQVIGHFVDPDKALQNISKLLAANGLVLVESWDMKSNMAKIMGKHWHEYSPPSVINWYSDATLTDFFNYHGFGLIAKGRPSKKISVKHGLSLFEESTPKFIFKKELMIFFSRILGKLKIYYPPFDVKWYLFKKL
jgi:2-polyprenyl-3-methyl-5-hydroxy-6-metoxy-1,4-benzoquinol methylase